MGLIFNGNGDVIKAVDGSLTVEGLDIGGSTNIEAGIGTFSGNLNVGGVLTYEDVKNVDSIGIVTAREGIFLPDTKELKLGNSAASPDLKLYSTGTNGWVFTPQSGADLYMGTNAGEVYIQTGSSGNDTAIKVNSGGSVELNHSTNKKFETTSTGATITGALNLTGASSGNYLNVGSSTVYANAAINIYRLGNGYADMRLSSNYGAKVALAGASNNTDEFYLQQDNQKNAYVWNEANKGITFGTNATGRMWLANNGNFRVVGISTFNSSVHVDGDLDVAADIRHIGDTDTRLRFETDTISARTAGSERLRIDSSGDVGIGTANPQSRKLHVLGTTRPVEIGSTNATNIVKLYNSATGRATYNGVDIVASSTDGGKFNVYGGSIMFGTSASNGSDVTERLRIDSAGRMGLGVSPTASHSNVTASIFLKDGNTLLSRTGGQFLGLFQNIKYTAQDAVRYISNGYGSAYHQDTGVHKFFTTAASGTGNTSATLLERLRITSDGITKFDRYSGTAGKGRIEFGNSGEQFIEGYDTGNAGSGSYLRFGDGSTERLRIDSSGRVGINQTSPTAKLHIVESTSTAGLKVKAGTGSDQTADIWCYNDNDQWLALGVWGSSANTSGLLTTNDGLVGSNHDLCLYSTNASGNIKFGAGSSYPELMRLTSNGRLLIKSTSAATSDTYLEVKNTAAHNEVNIISKTTHAALINLGDTDSYNRGRIKYDNSDDSLTFRTSATDRLRITSDGDFGTNGVTPTTQSGRVFHLHAGNAQQRFHMTNNTTGVSATDGFEIIVEQSANTRIRNFESGDMAFDTGGSNNECMRITSAGKLLVGRTSSITIASDPSDHNFEQLTSNGMVMGLHCNQSVKRGLGIYYVAGGTHSDYIRCQTGSSAKFLVIGNGNCQNANNTYTNISDSRLKENIVDANSQWNDIKNIKIRNYNFKESTGYETHTQIGVIAQEIETVCPKLVDSSGKDGIKAVASSVLYMKAVKALQEAMTRIESLEAEVAALKSS